MQRICKDDFITTANKIHGNKYNYSLVNYTNNKSKVKIICKQHGIFHMAPNSHTSGKQGCPKCGIEKRSIQNRIPKNVFLKKANKIHGNKYDYSKMNYTCIKNKVTLTCNQCGYEFQQIAYNHLAGCGCRNCLNMAKSDTPTFINKAKLKHGNNFDYTSVNYINCMEKVNIKCNCCLKIFEQIPNDHLDGHGCPHCSKRYPLTIVEFISRCKKIHKNKYDYSTVEYINTSTKVNIFCNKCKKIFKQTPSHHFNGHGCPSCFSKIYRISQGEIEFLDKIKIKNRQVFIGKICVDGYDPVTNTIYEFLGDYYHGNPKLFDSTMFNKTCKKTFGELYEKTFQKFEELKSNGFNIFYIWENEWNSYKKRKILKLPLKQY